MLRFPGLPDTFIPAYRHYRSPGQAVVTLGGRDTYLGVYGTADCKQKYKDPAGHAPVAVAVRPGVRQAPRRRRPPDAGGPVTVGGPH